MTQVKENNLLATLMQMVNENGIEAVTETFRILLNEAMKIERDQALGAGLYERSEDRRGYANGYKTKTIDTRMGKLMVNVPQVRGGVQFYPSALEKGCRSERALKLAIAEMYVQGVSTRRITDVLEKMCGLSVSSTQVSRVAQILDEELEKWRNRPLGEYPYLVLDAQQKSQNCRFCGLLCPVNGNRDRY
jgi:transposase-like protein